jgi:S-adenosylhomocysteine hydrolase
LYECCCESPFGQDYVIADIRCRLGPQGNQHRRSEMPGLMAIRAEYAKTPAAEGRAHHGLAAHDIQTCRADRDAAGARGAQVRWASCNVVLRTQDHAAAAMAVRGTPSSPTRAEIAGRLTGKFTHKIFEWPDNWLLEHDPGTTAATPRCCCISGTRRESDSHGAGQARAAKRNLAVQLDQGGSSKVDPKWYLGAA